MGDTRSLLLVAVAATVLLAGCSGGGGSTTPTATDVGPTATPTATDAPTATTTGGGTPTATATATAADPSFDVATVRSAAVDAISGTDAYRIDANVSATLKGPVTQRYSQQIRTLVDREAREFRRNVTAEVMGRTSESAAYLVNETLYLRNQAYVRQYSSAWIRTDVSENFSEYWERQDTLGQMRRLLEKASGFELEGTGSVDGTETAVLSVELSTEEFRSVLGNNTALQLGSNVSVRTARYTLEVDPDTGRLLAATSHVNATLTIRRQTVTTNSTTTYRFEYGVDPAISLPEAAENAYNVSQGTSGTTTGSLVPARSATARGSLAGAHGERAVPLATEP